MAPMKTAGYTFLPTSEILSAMASHSASIRADQRDPAMGNGTDTDNHTNDDSDADADGDTDRPGRPFLPPALRSESFAARRSSEWSTTTNTSSTALLAPSTSASTSSSTLPSTSFDLESAPGLFSSLRNPSARKRRLHRIRTGYFSWPLICGMFAVLVLVYTAIDHFLPDSSLLSLSGGVYTHAGQESVYAGQAQGGGSDTAPHHVAVAVGDADADPALIGVMPFKGDTTHVLVPITPIPPSLDLLRPITTRPPHRVLSTYYLDGTYHSEGSPAPQSQLDIVYLWVNSTSRFFQDALVAKAAEEHVVGARGRARRWRDNGELRPAIRSAVQHLGNALRKVHLLTGDYEFPLDEFRDRLPYEDEMEEGVEVLGWRAGQIPTWLDWDRVANANAVGAGASANGKVAWHPHSEVFRLPKDHGVLDGRLRDGTGQEEEKWREEAIPSFDSFEIESRVGWISGLSENFVLSNDDMFILSSLSASDFHHPLLGTVVRFEPSPQLLVKPVFTPDLLSTPGEWGGLQHASLLLSKRFPSRPRMYMHHMPKALTRSLVQEASVMFAEDLTKAATRAFRESRRGEGDVEIAWLVTHLGVERWREALLWSWAVAKVGGEAGEWGDGAREEVRGVLKIKAGGEGEVEDEVMVVKGKRSTLGNVAAITKRAGWGMPRKSTYTFSSMDGHLPPRPDIDIISTSCSISLSKCFAPDFLSSSTPYPAQEIFRNIAFVHPECGDCLIDALVTASGTRGLSAFLPSETDVYYPEQRDPAEWERSEPMLPLTSTWEGVDFSLNRVVRPGQDTWDGIQPAEDGAVRLREWCIKLLSRYAYTFAITPSHFAMVRTYRQLENTLASFDRREDLAMVCINDDQPDYAGEENRRVYREWTERRWGKVQATWEREWGMKRFEGKRGRRSMKRKSEQKEVGTG
ncbi:hypothetical protein EHS25_008659 [Saitozyma podzolica]|uniref:Stealth protein CR3 conserved region 3 domain-containing protein n=1 Tax=Saitozyma podzolica TaxID=1890683 RepID=A0A427YMA1_9TREE|nr:hypothetical protein EHS25_008659 [Saitozyma podzolica]